MRVEMFGAYQLELSARQFINHGGWAAFASVRKLDDGADLPISVLPFQHVAEQVVFATESAAIDAARGVVVELIATQ